MPNENLGPAERIIQTMISYSDHAVHNRPGVVVPDTSSVTGVRWYPAIWKLENGSKVVYRKDKVGVGKNQKTQLTRLGVMNPDETIPGVGRYMAPGLFPEVVVWLYRQMAEIWKLDNEFAARWASYAYTQDHRDLKAVLAAFLLVQNRKGDPVLEGGKVLFQDEDFRDVGEAIMLCDGKNFLDVKRLLRIREILALPGVAAINRELGFGNSTRSTFFGRYQKAAERWLRYRESNPRMLQGLVNKGFRNNVRRLAQVVRYKPETPKFFETLRWKQDQSKAGHRTLAIGVAVKAAESWADLTERQICERIVTTKPNFKRLVGLLPENLGLTPAIMAAAIESGSLSDKDLVIYAPTLEELGLLKDPDIRERWSRALSKAEDQRAANIALRMKSQENREVLVATAEVAGQKAVAEVIKGIRIYVLVDVSGSLSTAIAEAKVVVSKLLVTIPLDQLHVAVFNTVGRIVEIKHTSEAGIARAFAGITASGGTSHASGIRKLAEFPPKDDEDTLILVVGDEEEAGDFAGAVRLSGLRPMAFGFVKVKQNVMGHRAVQNTAAQLGVPCFLIDDKTFEDVYAVPRTIRTLVASTPVGVRERKVEVPRETLVDTILKTDLLKKPVWASA